LFEEIKLIVVSHVRTEIDLKSERESVLDLNDGISGVGDNGERVQTNFRLKRSTVVQREKSKVRHGTGSANQFAVQLPKEPSCFVASDPDDLLSSSAMGLCNGLAVAQYRHLRLQLSGASGLVLRSFRPESAKWPKRIVCK
jgi:hypothetical protein